jgi:hypothetical protein
MTEAQRIAKRRAQGRQSQRDYAWKRKQLLKQVTAAPWADDKAKAMRDAPERWPLIWILLDAEDAKVLSGGDVPEEIAQQCDRALAGLD